jgi:hypothetical protein
MSSNTNALGYPKLQTKTPVPSDIEISQQIVKEVGPLSMEEVARQLRIILCHGCSMYESLSLFLTHTHTLVESFSLLVMLLPRSLYVPQTRSGPDPRRNHSVGHCQSQSTTRGIRPPS